MLALLLGLALVLTVPIARATPMFMIDPPELRSST